MADREEKVALQYGQYQVTEPGGNETIHTSLVAIPAAQWPSLDMYFSPHGPGP
ncbi:predicted protein [Coccidioides posadasii str. Silveira]|uniref:Predicted protein n=1 Tax=Coccidioides posadasii (strain RMSCC 757 / Silveira) TaxID=443226 RepID=E9CWS9_COCPS|nr:predicted protein [Coccidioides posadasii str. Silveira]